MKLPITPVPNGKCALDVLAELGNRTQNSWIYLHKNVVNDLLEKADSFSEHYEENYWYYSLHWDATDEFPETNLDLHWNVVFSEQISRDYSIWVEVVSIDADDIAFKHPAKFPEEIFFLKNESQ